MFLDQIKHVNEQRYYYYCQNVKKSCAYCRFLCFISVLQLHLAIAVAENFARRHAQDRQDGPTPSIRSAAGTPRVVSALSEGRLNAVSTPHLNGVGQSVSMAALSTPTIHLNNGTLSRASSRKSLGGQSEYIYPDTIRTRVTHDDCPVCQILMPKGPHGCVCVT